jgi:hypothetical protein
MTAHIATPRQTLAFRRNNFPQPAIYFVCRSGHSASEAQDVANEAASDDGNWRDADND